VTARGMEQRVLFRDDRDRLAYLEYLTRAVRGSGTIVLAWSLMPNHVHLLIRTGARPLEKVMQILGTNYAQYFNRRHRRQGYVFQGRYDSSLIEEDAYLLAAIRYVHLNPVKAGIVASVEELVDYPWTGHAALLGRASPVFQDVEAVRLLFDDDQEEARRRLCDWMGAEGIGDDEALLAASRNEDPAGGAVVVSGSPLHRDARAAGSPDFADEVLREVQGCSAAPVAARRSRWDLDRAVLYVCSALRVDAGAVRKGRRTKEASRARAAVAYLAHRDLAISLSAMTSALGVSLSALSRALERGKKVAEEESLALE
jgi:REP element-mobilizing transposase RayT/precorrin-6B methylase 1